MRITYDAEADALWIELAKPGAEGYGEDLEQGVILHRDKDGQVVALEVLDARKRLGGEPPPAVKVHRLRGPGG